MLALELQERRENINDNEITEMGRGTEE